MFEGERVGSDLYTGRSHSGMMTRRALSLEQLRLGVEVDRRVCV